MRWLTVVVVGVITGGCGVVGVVPLVVDDADSGGGLRHHVGSVVAGGRRGGGGGRIAVVVGSWRLWLSVGVVVGVSSPSFAVGG